jgi:hypothetical protein
MNRADLVFAICHLLGLRPAAPRDVPTEEAGHVRRAVGL